MDEVLWPTYRGWLEGPFWASNLSVSEAMEGASTTSSWQRLSCLRHPSIGSFPSQYSVLTSLHFIRFYLTFISLPLFVLPGHPVPTSFLRHSAPPVPVPSMHIWVLFCYQISALLPITQRWPQGFAGGSNCIVVAGMFYHIKTLTVIHSWFSSFNSPCIIPYLQLLPILYHPQIYSLFQIINEDVN